MPFIKPNVSREVYEKRSTEEEIKRVYPTRRERLYVRKLQIKAGHR